MEDIYQLKDQFLKFIYLGLDHSIASVHKSNQPLIPFVMTQHGEHHELKRFVSSDYQEGIRAAENEVRSLSPLPDYVLLAYDGYVTLGNVKYDAVFVQAFSPEQENGYQFWQRYQFKSGSNGIEEIGDFAFSGYLPNLLSTQLKVSV